MEIPDFFTDRVDMQECTSLRFAMETLFEIAKRTDDLEDVANLKCHLIALFNILPVCNYILAEHIKEKALDEDIDAKLHIDP